MKLYIDTNVYLDYFLNRKNVFQIFNRTISCEFYIIVSDHLFNELAKHIQPSDVRFFFATLKHKIIKISTDKEDILNAKLIDTHYADALHIVLAKKSEASIIVTRNLKDFEGLFKTKSPEDF